MWILASTFERLAVSRLWANVEDVEVLPREKRILRPFSVISPYFNSSNSLNHSRTVWVLGRYLESKVSRTSRAVTSPPLNSASEIIFARLLSRASGLQTSIRSEERFS